MLGIASRAAGRPVPYLEELAPDLFVWLTALGAADALRHGAHLATEVVIDRLPAAPRRAVRWAAALAGFAFLGAVAGAGVLITVRSAQQGETAQIGYPAWLVKAAVPAGALLALVFAARRAIMGAPAGRAPDARQLR